MLRGPDQNPGVLGGLSLIVLGLAILVISNQLPYEIDSREVIAIVGRIGGAALLVLGCLQIIDETDSFDL